MKPKTAALRARLLGFGWILGCIVACARDEGFADDNAGQGFASATNGVSTEEARGPDTATTETAPVDLPEGLVGIDGASLIQRVRASSSKAVLVNVWASWCGACKAEIPMLSKLKEQYRPLGIDFVFVSVDKPEAADAAVAFLKQHEMPLPGYLVLGRLGLFKQAMSPLWPGSLPASFLFDTNGKLRYFWGAQVFEEELTPILDGFLAGKDIDGVANVMIRRGGGPPE